MKRATPSRCICVHRRTGRTWARVLAHPRCPAAQAARSYHMESDQVTMTDYVCGDCGEEFASNCLPGDITCPECEAHLCSHCGQWDAMPS